MKRPLSLCALFCCILSPIVTLADVRLPSVLSDGMVLQQQSEVRLWGWADPGEAVTVTPSWPDAKPESATAADDGRWRVALRTPAAGGPHEIAFAGKNQLALRDVLIGEVWLCSGQSNMEWPVGRVRGAPGIDNFEAEIAAADFPRIRLFRVERARSDTPLEDVTGRWQPCTPATIAEFSAVAYFFGRRLHRELDVPIGLIQSAWGGTEIELWTSREAMRAQPEFREALDRLPEDQKQREAEHAEWRTKFEALDAGWNRWHEPALDDSAWTPARVLGLWDESLAGFDGVVWYRAMLNLPTEWSDPPARLELGAIDDEDVTWINGRQIGSTSGAFTQRVYPVPPGLLKPGVNRLVVRVRDRGWQGGFRLAPNQPALLAEGGPPIRPTAWRWKIGVDQKDAPREPAAIVREHATLYNAMIAPLTPLRIRGFTWYQGESNVVRARQYRTAFPAMIRDWRSAFGDDALPFHFVQIAPFEYGGLLANATLAPGCASAELREAQALALELPHTGMVVATDITSNVRDIHPGNKQDVGARLAGLALADPYGRDLIHSGPRFRDAKPEAGGLRIRLHHADGLRTRPAAEPSGTSTTAQPTGAAAQPSGAAAQPSGAAAQPTAQTTPELTGFVAAGPDRVFVPATAKIEGRDLIVHAVDGREIVAVRFGWCDACIPNLINAAGLPAEPFRTDDWPGATDANRW
ncbi:MAG: beta galactosidase jelly roll domain-containing protein [Phycisphaerales bacterium]|nr:beta galactosidase jelly roll domain-containing protein [Phycisphaerales bacterium]